MARYVDGFVLPIPKQRIEEYTAIARAASKIWKEHGALDYWECVGDDLDTDPECSSSFVDMAGAKEDETVIFAWAVFESRQSRDEANEKIMADPRIADLMNELVDANGPIFDSKRMAHGGFKEIVHA